MGRSCLLADDAIVLRRAQGNRSDPAGGFRNAPYLSMTVPGGAGGIGSTLQDLVAFERASVAEDASTYADHDDPDVTLHFPQANVCALSYAFSG